MKTLLIISIILISFSTYGDTVRLKACTDKKIKIETRSGKTLFAQNGKIFLKNGKRIKTSGMMFCADGVWNFECPMFGCRVGCDFGYLEDEAGCRKGCRCKFKNQKKLVINKNNQKNIIIRCKDEKIKFKGSNNSIKLFNCNHVRIEGNNNSIKIINKRYYQLKKKFKTKDALFFQYLWIEGNNNKTNVKGYFNFYVLEGHDNNTRFFNRINSIKIRGVNNKIRYKRYKKYKTKIVDNGNFTEIIRK